MLDLISFYNFLKQILLKESKIKRMIKKLLNSKMRSIIWSTIMIFFKIKSPKMKKETRAYLNRYFKNEVDKLSTLIERDLNTWTR